MERSVFGRNSTVGGDAQAGGAPCLSTKHGSDVWLLLNIKSSFRDLYSLPVAAAEVILTALNACV